MSENDKYTFKYAPFKPFIKNDVSYERISKEEILEIAEKVFFGKSITTKDNEQIFVSDTTWISGAPLFWNQGFMGEKVRVGVIDSGICRKHPDLKVAGGKSFVGDDYSVLDDHGTHVAGIIAANGFLKGIAPKVELYDYRVFDTSGNATGSIVEAIYQAVKDGCHVINMSLGSMFPSDSMKEAIEYADSHGVIMVVAGGNEGDFKKWNDEVVSFPAYYPETISVAAVDFDLSKNGITIVNTKFSNRNDKVTCCADGYKVLSTMPVMMKGKKTDKIYGVISGTSMAAPVVAGIVALIYSKLQYIFPLIRPNLDLKNAVLAALCSYFVPIDVGDLEGDDKPHDIVTGFGFVTLYGEIPRLIKDDHFDLKSLVDFAPNIKGVEAQQVATQNVQNNCCTIV